MSKCVAKWLYKDKAGELLGHVCRFEDGSIKENGKAKKEIIPYFVKDGDSFKAGLPQSFKEKRPLYGLDRLKDSLKAVFIVEGEKCASALNDLGFQTITSLGGCETVQKVDWEALKDIKQAVLLPDNDEAGKRYSKAVYKRLKAVNPSIDFSIGTSAKVSK